MSRRLAAFLLVVLTACHRDEPMAGGQPLSYWKKEAQQVSWMTFWNSTKDERRRVAFQRLSEIGEPAVPALMDLFRKNSISVSGDAFNVLANLGPRAASAVPALVRMLNAGPPQARGRAAWILGTIGPAAEPAVASLTPLLNQPDQRVRQAAAQALGQIGGSGLAALERARGSADPRLREASMRGMAARPRDTAGRREYLAVGLADTDPDVRLRAVDLLMNARREDVEALTDYLIKALNDPDQRVSAAAHTVFNVYRQNGGATPALLAAVLASGDAESRADAAWHLADAVDGPPRPGGSPSAVGATEALTAALASPDPKVRIYAARALALSDGPSRQRGLRALRHEIPNAEPILAVRAARVLWIADRNLADVRPAYEAGLRDPAKWNRVETISAIIEMGHAGESFIPRLEELKNDPDPEVRDRAAKALYAMRLKR
jgi:HEAT repeat protein